MEKWIVVDLYFVRLAKLELHFPEIPSLYTFELRGHKRQFAWGVEGEEAATFFLCLEGQSRGTKCCYRLCMLPFIFWLIFFFLYRCATKLQLCQFPLDLPSVSLTPALCAYLALWWRAPASPVGYCIIKMEGLEAVREPWVLVSLCGCWFVFVLPPFTSIFPA